MEEIKKLKAYHHKCNCGITSTFLYTDDSNLEEKVFCVNNECPTEKKYDKWKK